MAMLTIFTPSYNRADLLPRCYESLKRQTCKDFIWMIIDDGSSDGTDILVNSWIDKENDFEIEYYYKENGGLHTAYNEAISHLRTELSMCIDSDDFVPDDAVEKVLDFWKKKGSKEYAGIVGLDYDLDNNVIGDKLPEQKSVNLIDLLIGKYPIHNGDRTNVVRSELYKEVAPMKSFEGEKNFNPHYMHLQISKKYDFLVLNENLRYVEYQPTGMSASILRQYKNSPNSFIETRKLYLSFPDTSFVFKFRQSIHLVSSCILAKKVKQIFSCTNNIWILLLALPFGFALTIYILIKTS
ncbi:MAG: glycosyltransferase family 2 protein [Erysipelotrichaceae bacterium]|nr:glycosyltransferase family 2 protein [Erysipelotrichaceae bacterium]